MKRKRTQYSKLKHVDLQPLESRLLLSATVGGDLSSAEVNPSVDSVQNGETRSSAEATAVRNADGTVDVSENVVGNADVVFPTSQTSALELLEDASSSRTVQSRSSAEATVVRNADGTVDVSENVVGNADVVFPTSQTSALELLEDASSSRTIQSRSSAEATVVRNADGTVDVSENVVGNADVVFPTSQTSALELLEDASSSRTVQSRSSAEATVVRNADGTVDVSENVVGNATIEINDGRSSRFQSLRDRFEAFSPQNVTTQTSNSRASFSSSSAGRNDAIDQFFAQFVRFGC